MSVAIEKVEFISAIMSCLQLEASDEQLIRKYLLVSQDSFVGKVDGEIACVWGLVTPTVLSNQAYLWLYHNELVLQHQFLFVRHSQRSMEVMLDCYPLIVGHVKPDAERSKRWLRWLGATFGRMDGRLLTFQIRKKNG